MSESSGEGDNNSYPQGNAPQDKNWEWIACVYDMKRSTPESEITWNLSPSIMLTLPSEQNVQPKVDLIIESSKQFIYSEGLGWNWHKSWNIPDIHCTLDIRDPLTNEKLLPPSKIYAEIYVVRAVINQIHTFHLVDVGIKGSNRSEFDSSRCVFTGLKFDTTSYNHEGSKFHLVIVVYLNQNKFEHPKILESRISPPIFVDSRKSARDTQHQKAQKLSSFIDPFLPENMDKKFVKRESKRKYNGEEAIENNIEGLSSFFSAPNIRHKVKHPLFLAIKFCSCVKIYFNVNIIPFNNNNEKFVEVMQKQLMEAYNRSSTNTNMNIEEKPLILTIEHQLTQQNFKSKKINEFLEPLHGDVLHVMIDPVTIPKNFKKLEDIEGVKEAYRKVYPKISQQKFSQGGDDDDDSPPVKTKGSKVKVEKDNKKNYQSDDSDGEYKGAHASKKIKGNNEQQLQSVIDGNKQQIKNPAQQSEIVLNQNAQNQQEMKSMIIQGAKPNKEKLPKGLEKQASKTEETPKAAAKGGRGKKGAKGAAAATATANEPVQMNSSQNIASQSQLPTQVPSTTQFSQQNVNGIPPGNMNTSGSQQTSNNNSMQWQQNQNNPNLQKPLNNSQQMYPGGDASMQTLNKGAPAGYPQVGQQGFQQQNMYGQNQPQVGSNSTDGNALGGFDGIKSINNQNGPYGQQPYNQHGQAVPGQQLNGMMNGQQRPPYQGGPQQGNAGYPQSQIGVPGTTLPNQGNLPQGQNQAYPYGNGNISASGQPQQPGIGQNQMNKQLSNPHVGVSKEGYEDPNLIAGRNASNSNVQAGQFKPPVSNPHLSQSQHYKGANVPGVQASQSGSDVVATQDPVDPLKQQQPQVGSSQYNMGQNQLQQPQGQTGLNYNAQQQYQQYQRNNSQQFIQQQGRIVPNQMSQQNKIPGQNPQGNQYYDQQQGYQFNQNIEGNQYGNNTINQNTQGNPQQYQMSNVQGQNPNFYEDDDQQFNNYQQNQQNRFTSNSQGQLQFQGQTGQNQQYNNYANQYQNHQNMNNQYGYTQANQYNNFQQNDQSMYFKQNMNPQFQQYYQQQQQFQQPNQQDALNNQGIQYAGQMRPHSNSIPQQQFYLPKEDEYQNGY